jgi:hypothetical protein
VLLIVSVSFPVPQPEVKKEAYVRAILITYEIDVTVQKSFVTVFPGRRFDEFARTTAQESHEYDRESQLQACAWMRKLIFVTHPHESYQVLGDWQRGYRLSISTRCDLSVLDEVFRDVIL